MFDTNRNKLSVETLAGIKIYQTTAQIQAATAATKAASVRAKLIADKQSARMEKVRSARAKSREKAAKKRALDKRRRTQASKALAKRRRIARAKRTAKRKLDRTETAASLAVSLRAQIRQELMDVAAKEAASAAIIAAKQLEQDKAAQAVVDARAELEARIKKEAEAKIREEYEMKMRLEQSRHEELRRLVWTTNNMRRQSERGLTTAPPHGYGLHYYLSGPDHAV